jgi:hypothetical protein
VEVNYLMTFTYISSSQSNVHRELLLLDILAHCTNIQYNEERILNEKGKNLKFTFTTDKPYLCQNFRKSFVWNKENGEHQTNRHTLIIRIDNTTGIHKLLTMYLAQH